MKFPKGTIAAGVAMLLAWMFAREGAQSRLGHNRSLLPKSVRYAKRTKQELLRVHALPGVALSSNDSASAWHQALRHLDGHVLGLIAFRAIRHVDPLTLLSSSQQCVREYWMCTKYSQDPLLLVELVAAAVFAVPVLVRSGEQGVAPAAFFFQCTNFSAGHLMQARSQGGESMEDLIRRWMAQWPELKPPDHLCWALPAVSEGSVVAVAMAPVGCRRPPGR